MHDPLISAGELKDRLGEEHLRVFDIRGRWGNPPQAFHDEYLAGHIPGAVYLDWIQRFLEPGPSIPEAPVAGLELARKSFSELGISDGDTVVLYDDSHHMFAARVWWSMRYWGFPQVRILNGGWSHWKAQGFPVSHVEETAVPGDFEPQEQSRLKVETAEVEEQRETSLLLDGRGESGFTAARIPGSISVPFRSLLDPETGLFLQDEVLEALLAGKASDWKQRPIISTCGAGYSATVVLLALMKLGHTAPLYDGSLAVWKKDPSHPIERG